MCKNNLKRQIKVGVIGCGKMGLHHLNAIQKIDNTSIVAVSDPFIDQSHKFQLLEENVKIFSDPQNLIDQVKPDVVHICTPPETHIDFTKYALQHGVNVYVEKPFALLRSDAEQAIKLAEESGVKVCAGHQILFEGAAIKALQNLKMLGKIIQVESYFSFRQVRRSLTSVEQLTDILPHPTYLLLHFLNKSSKSQWKEKVDIRFLDIAPNFDVHGILRMGDVTGILTVTLDARPVESYLKVVGTNGSLYADFVRGTTILLPGPGTSVVSAILYPYSLAKQLAVNSTSAFFRRALRKQKSYPGLLELINAFYKCILNGKPAPISNDLIINTVHVCQKITEKLREVEAESNKRGRLELESLEKKISPPDPDKDLILVTGGTGFLGKVVVSELRNKGYPVRVITRRLPSFSHRVPGVEYVVADLYNSVPISFLEGVDTVIHCAAETAGKKADHERNTVSATKNIIDLSYQADIGRFIHISSVAVIKSNKDVVRPLDENSPIDVGNIKRGPYVWAKAESEQLITKKCSDLGIEHRIIRLGPLIDLNAFQAPGRLGREFGRRFIAVGGKNTKISLCEVQTAAKIIRLYLDEFESLPKVLNLVEPEPPTRFELFQMLIKERPDLKVTWIPFFIIRLASATFKPLFSFILGMKEPIDIYAAFSTEDYNTNLASEIIKKVKLQ